MADLLFTYVIDASDFLDKMAGIDRAAAESAEQDARALADGMKDILDDAAQQALASAAYRRRTGDLDQSTFAGNVTVTGRGEMRCQFGARADYASYVEDRGFSRTEEIAEEAADRIAAMIEQTL